MPEPTVRLSSGEPLTWTMRQVFELAVPFDYAHLLPLLRQEHLAEGVVAVEALDRSEPSDRERPQAWLEGYSDGIAAAAAELRRLAAAPTTTTTPEEH
jgi:hypothetical protein